jgi:hypothetical protein
MIMLRKSNFLYLLPLLSLSFTSCGYPEAEIERIHQEQHDAQIKIDPSQTKSKCLAEEDRSLLFSDNLQFARDMEQCIIKHINILLPWNSWAELDKGKFKGFYPQMTDGCIDCFDQMTRCAADNCKTPCVGDSASDSCQTCSEEYCGMEMLMCSGIRSEDLPKLHRRSTQID